MKVLALALQVTAFAHGFLMVMKSYEPSELVLDEQVQVVYTFFNAGEQ